MSFKRRYIYVKQSREVKEDELRYAVAILHDKYQESRAMFRNVNTDIGR